MKRPLCLFALIITAFVYLYLEFYLSYFLKCYSDEGDGSPIQIVGIVDRKEMRIDYEGDLSPVIYIIPRNVDIGRNKYIQCYISKEDYAEPGIGQYVQVSGKKQLFSATRNPGEFDSRLYYSTLKTAYRIKDARIKSIGGRINYVYEGLYHIKLRLEKTLDSALDTKDASIMKAIILGDKAFMETETKELYQAAGIIHIMAVSGLHISIIGMGLFRLLRKIKMHVLPASVMAIVFMYLYGQMCGMSSSAERAIVMFGLRLFAPLIGRSYDLLSALSLVEIMMLLDQPLFLYNSGFLFSFGAVAAIGYVLPALMTLFPDNRKEIMRFSDDPGDGKGTKLLNYLKSGLLSGISIFMVTLPVYLTSYYVYPVYSIFLNLLIIPLMAPLMLLGIMCMFIGMTFVPCSIIPGTVIHLILELYSTLCEITEKIPGHKWYIGHGNKLEIVVYIAVLGITVAIINNYRDSKRKILFAMTAIVMAFLMVIINPMPDLKITAIDVGQGDGIVLRTRKETYLIDGGSTDKKQVGKYTIIPFLKYEGIGVIDAAIITHEDKDHISGVFEIMDDMGRGGIEIKNLILPDIAEDSKGENYRLLEERAKELGIPVGYISCGEKIKTKTSLGKKNLELLCLNPYEGMSTDSANAYSTVLYLKYGEFTALLTGDMEEEGEAHFLVDLRENREMYGKLTLLKAAHHGSKYSTSEEMLDILKPKLSLISCGVGNSYGHPHKELIKRLEDHESVIFRTDESGAVSIVVKGNKVNVCEYLHKE